MPTTLLARPKLERSHLIRWYQRNRERSRALFDLLAGDEAYYGRPISLRHPLVFYEGHLPAFSFNTLVKRALGGPSIDPRLEALFARGIDPDTTATPDPHLTQWPSRSAVRGFADEADARVLDALAHAGLDVPGHPLLDRAEAAFTILEHEVMHHETMLYMWHQLPLRLKHAPTGYTPLVEGNPPREDWIDVPAGDATLGVDRDALPFGWDNEFPACAALVSAFSMARHKVTNAQFMEFVAARGYEQEQYWTPEDWAWMRGETIRHPLFWERDGSEWYWRGMFSRLPLPAAWPVYVSHAEASAFARFRGGRLPSEAEFQRAAYATPEGRERPFPWGDDDPDPSRGVFDFASWDPQPVGAHPAGQSAWGFDELVGNGWEWTSTPFAPFPGFRPMASYPEYSADFFDGDHVVLKGASPGTGRELLRPSFRNWFRRHYPYVYASFRYVKEAR